MDNRKGWVKRDDASLYEDDVGQEVWDTKRLNMDGDPVYQLRIDPMPGRGWELTLYDVANQLYEYRSKHRTKKAALAQASRVRKSFGDPTGGTS